MEVYKNLRSDLYKNYIISIFLDKLLKYTDKFKKSKLLTGTFWTILGSGLSRVGLFIGSVLCANILGAEAYGQFGITRSTINVILLIAGLNIGSVLTKYISEYSEKAPQKCAQIITQNYLFVLLLTFVLAILVFIFAGVISSTFLNTPELKNEIRLSTLVLVFGIAFPLNESIYRGFEWFKRLGVIQVISSVSFAVFVPVGSYYFGVIGAILGYLVYTVTMFLITSFDLRSYLKTNNIELVNLTNQLFDFSQLKTLTIPVLFASIIEGPFFWSSQVILVKYAGMHENGIANAILQIRNLILIIPGYVLLVTLPLFSKALSDNNKKNYQSNLKNSLLINISITLICVLPLLLFPNHFLKLFGVEFKADYLVSFLAYISVPFVVISGIYNQSLIAKNKGWLNFRISLIWNVVLLITAYLFIKTFEFGLLGYMLSLFSAILFQTILRFYYDRKH